MECHNPPTDHECGGSVAGALLQSFRHALGLLPSLRFSNAQAHVLGQYGLQWFQRDRLQQPTTAGQPNDKAKNGGRTLTRSILARMSAASSWNVCNVRTNPSECR